MVLNLKEIYSDSWGIFVKNWWQYVVFSIIMIAMTIVPFLGPILQIVMALLLLKAIFKSIKGENISFSDFFNFKSVFNNTGIALIIIVGCVYALLDLLDYSVLYIILSLAYFILSIILFPIFCVAIDKYLPLKEAVLYSAKLTKNMRLEILLVMVINFIIGLVGVFCFFIGIFVAIPIVFIAMFVIYRKLEEISNKKVENI